MGKPKKEKRGQQAEESGDDDFTIDPLAVTETPPETLAGKKTSAKGKNKVKKLEDDSDESDEDITKEDAAESTTSKKPAPKKKKGKKKKDDDWEDDVAAELAALSMEANAGHLTEQNGVENDDHPAMKKKVKTRGKKLKDDTDEIVDDNAVDVPKNQPKSKKKPVAMFQILDMLDDDNDNSGSEVKTRGKKLKDDTDEIVDDNAVDVPKNQPKSKKKPVAMFQILDMLDDDNDNSGSEADDKASEDDTSDIPVVIKETSKKQKKKGKEKEKKKTVEEENIDALLAEINKPAEKSSKKSKKDKKKQKGEEDMEADDTTTPSEQSQQTSAVETGDTAIDALEELAMEQEETLVSTDKDGEMEEKAEEDVEGEHTVKTAAQKKKEKKEKEKLKKQKTKSVKTKQPSLDDDKPITEAAAAEDEEGGTKEEGDEKEDETGKKKKKKGDKEEKGKKKPNKAVISAMKEALLKAKEEEERLRQEEEDKIRREDEAILKREEQKKLDEERKERKRQKEKEKKERLRSEGKLLTEKQKQDRRRALQMLELMKQQGLEVPSKDDGPKKKPVYGDKKKRRRPQTEDGQVTHEQTPSPTEELISKQDDVTPEEPVPVEATSQEVETEDVQVKDDTKDAWDAESEEEKEEEKEDEPETAEVVEKLPIAQAELKVGESDDEEEGEGDAAEEADEDDQDESDEDEEESDEGSEEESSDESTEELTAVDRGREKITKRREEAEKKRSVNVLRAPVVVVLGHVDTGKTKLLDKLRKTNVQDGEAGGITQQIGATNVPFEAIREKTYMCKEFAKAELKLPGLLIIDTPGHASFSNLRTRGSSLCDVAILVVDIMHGLEPQTIESINLLKKKKTPFIVALNKVDRLYQWKTNPNNDVMNTIKKQQGFTKQEFDERTRDIVVQFAEQSLNVALFYENKNKREYISMVPTSAHTGDGMGNLVSQICELSQSMLAKRLAYSEELQATVMEVKAIHGLGTAIDVILVNGKIHEGDTIVVAGTEGPIVTQIRAVLMPQPMKELRVKNTYDHFKEVKAAQGVKVIAKDLDKALAGLPFYVAHGQDEIEYYKEDVAIALKEVLGAIKLTERGVFVQASTLGSLEALLVYLKDSKIPYAGINIGPVHKKDIMKASVMLEHDSQYACILAFDVKIERESQELADSLGVTIFTADIIYHLFDKFMAHRDELKKRRQEEFKHIAVFPCKLRILPQCIFNTRDPIVVGVSVEAGFVREGTPLCVPSKEFIDIGRISSIEINHKTTPIARKGQEVCIKIDPIGDTPKLYGRHFDHTDILCSKISRQSIDAVKDYFREDMQKTDWQLMVQLKKMFEIL